MVSLQFQSRGFILPLALWVIAATGLAAAILSEWVSQAVINAQVLQQKAEAELAFANIRNELIFVFARRPLTYRGLQVGEFTNPNIGTSLGDVMNANFDSDRMVYLDGRPYVISSDPRYAVKIQDGRGLVNLNIVNASYLNRFFDAVGTPEDDWGPLSATLLDYRDEDDLNRLAGAEQNDYLRRGLYPPSNFQLLTPWEAQRIIGWTQLDTLWSAQFEAPIITTCRSSGFNPNTAPPQALATYLDGVDVERTDSLLEYRETNPFRNTRELGAAAGVILVNQPFFFSFNPGRCILVDLIERDTNERLRFSLTLLPLNHSQPWQIDYVIRIPERYRRSMDQLDSENSFPSPEEIVGGFGDIEDTTGF